jgi:hypothetical protein
MRVNNLIAITNVDGVATLGGFEDVFASIVGVLLGLSGVALFLMLIVGGYKLITSGDNPQNAEIAKKTITYAIGGMVLIASAYLILRFIGVFTGADLNTFRVVI